MDWNVFMELAKNLGAPGLIVGFMIWDRIERNKIDRHRTAADVEMAKGLVSMGKDFQHLAELIRGNGNK